MERRCAVFKRAEYRVARAIGASTLIAASIFGSAPPGAAHSLKELEDQISDREAYFQPVDRPAPEFTLENADGRAVDLEDFRGKVVVLNFIYTTCPDVCPLHSERVAEIQEMINGTPMRDSVQFLSITTDPERDTAEVMRDYGATHGLDPANWLFLTGGPDEPEATRALAERFGHKFTPTGDGYQMHGVVTHVVDREGRLRANFHGLEFDPTNLVLYVNALVNDVHTSEAPGDHHRSFWDMIKDLL